MNTCLVTGSADDGGEDSAGGVVSGESGLAHAGAVVHDQSGGVLVTHDELGCAVLQLGRGV
jgi:hypothetical protein